MKKSELKQLIRETIEEELQSYEPQYMVALRHKTKGHWDIISRKAWNRGGYLDITPQNYDAYEVGGPIK